MRELSLQDVRSVSGGERLPSVSVAAAVTAPVTSLVNMSPLDIVPWVSGYYAAVYGAHLAETVPLAAITSSTGNSLVGFALCGVGAGVGLAIGLVAGQVFSQIVLSKIS